MLFLQWDKKGRFKLPRENYITGAVKGNGKTLGLTNGTNNFGLNNGSSGGAFAYASNFDVNVGTVRSGTALSANKSFGLTTDSSKSGIIIDRDLSKYLFFFVN